MDHRGSDEAERMAVLEGLDVLDTPTERAYQLVVELAAQLCQTEISLVSLIDTDRQWFKANVGLEGVRETPREVAFCDQAIRYGSLLQVPDALEDSRFCTNPLVLNAPYIRFYAGWPLVVDNQSLGTLCVIDPKPRRLEAEQVEQLRALAAVASELLALRRSPESVRRRLHSIQSEGVEAEALLSLLLGRLPCGVRYLDRDLKTVYSNDAYHRLKAPAESFIHNDETGAQICRSLRGLGNAASITGIQAPVSWEEKRKRVQGAPHWVDVMLVPTLSSSEQETTGYVEITVDVSERAEKQIASSHLAAIINTAVVAIISTDQGGRIAHWNHGAKQMFGYDEESILGREITILCDEGDVAYQEWVHEILLKGARLPSLEVRRKRLDGTCVDVLMSGAPIQNEASQIVGVSYVLQDISEQRESARALNRSKGRLARLYDLTPALLHSIDSTGKIISVSDQWLKVFGYTREEVLGKSSVDFLTAASKQVAAQILPDFFEKGECHNVSYQWVCKDGSLRDILLSAIAEYDEAGVFMRSLAVLEDVTERKKAERALAESHELLRVTLHSIADAVIATDVSILVTYMNPAAERLTGWKLDDALGRPLAEVMQVFDEDTDEPIPLPLKRSIDLGRPVDLAPNGLLRSRDGSTYGIEDSAAPIRGGEGQILGGVIVFHDVTERRRLGQEMKHRATVDQLTGLMNRVEFELCLRESLAGCEGSTARHVLLYIDLDQFKIVNDTCGHAAGDLLLKQLAGILRSRLRAVDTLARLGGDEFGAILHGCGPEAGLRIANSICEAVDEFRFAHQVGRFRVGASIGLVCIDASWPGAMDIMQAADQACYAAKHAGRGRVTVWAPQSQDVQVLQGQLRWVRNLEEAMDDDRLLIYGQRIFAAEKTEAPSHVETLMRLKLPDGAIVSPGAFLPAAERYGMIGRLDRWMLRAVVAWMAEHREAVQRVDSISVNISGESIGDWAFLELILELLEDRPCLAHKLCIEITESAALGNLKDGIEFIERVKELGVRFSLDDFGSGFASFEYLKMLPVDYLKIDGQFFKKIVGEVVDQATVRCIQEVADTLKIATVAEYVHDGATLEMVCRLGVGYVQGFHLHKPAPIDDVLCALARPQMAACGSATEILP